MLLAVATAAWLSTLIRLFWLLEHWFTPIAIGFFFVLSESGVVLLPMNTYWFHHILKFFVQVVVLFITHIIKVMENKLAFSLFRWANICYLLRFSNRLWRFFLTDYQWRHFVLIQFIFQFWWITLSSFIFGQINLGLNISGFNLLNELLTSNTWVTAVGRISGFLSF